MDKYLQVSELASLIIWCDRELVSFSEVSPTCLWAAKISHIDRLRKYSLNTFTKLIPDGSNVYPHRYWSIALDADHCLLFLRPTSQPQFLSASRGQSKKTSAMLKKKQNIASVSQNVYVWPLDHLKAWDCDQILNSRGPWHSHCRFLVQRFLFWILSPESVKNAKATHIRLYLAQWDGLVKQCSSHSLCGCRYRIQLSLWFLSSCKFSHCLFARMQRWWLQHKNNKLFNICTCLHKSNTK